MNEVTSSAALPPHAKAIDIRRETCPMTLVRTRLALDSLHSHDVLLVWLSGEEPISSVPRAVIDQGHDVRDVINQESGSVILVIVKDGLRL